MRLVGGWRGSRKVACGESDIKANGKKQTTGSFIVRTTETAQMQHVHVCRASSLENEKHHEQERIEFKTKRYITYR